MILSFMSAGMNSVARALKAALATSCGFTPAFSSTKLCAMAIFGMLPSALSTTWIFSPGLAVISVTEYFIVSEPVISTVRPPAAEPAFAAAAGAFLV